MMRCGVPITLPGDLPEVFQAAAKELHGSLMEDPHAHSWTQISIPLSRALTVMTGGHALVVAPMTALWMPAGVVHQAQVDRSVQVCSLYVNPRLVMAGPNMACAIQTTPFVRELVLHMSSLDDRQRQSPYGLQLLEIFLANAVPSPTERVSLKMPSDRRLRVVAHAVLADPADERTLEEWSGVVGASYRTLARHFIKETGLTFHEWKQTACVIEAMKALGTGHRVCNVAAELGYSSVSGFTAMFKRITGCTPSEYARVHEHAAAAAS